MHTFHFFFRELFLTAVEIKQVNPLREKYYH